MIKKLLLFNEYFERNKAYYTLLELAIIAGILYTFRITDFLHAPLVTAHVSNLIGSIIGTLLIIGPASFQKPRLHAKRIGAAIIIMTALNLSLELSAPINTIDLPFLYWEYFNTPDLVDAVFGISGIAMIVGIIKVRAHRAFKE